MSPDNVKGLISTAVNQPGAGFRVPELNSASADAERPMGSGTWTGEGVGCVRDKVPLGHPTWDSQTQGLGHVLLCQLP